MNYTIRPATSADYEILCSIYQEIDALHRENLPDRFRLPDGPARDKASLLERMGDDDGMFLVAEAETDLLGFVQATVTAPPDLPIFRPRCCVHINEIVVRGQHQGQGIGQGLMAAVEDWAKARGAVSVELDVYEFNDAALGFYDRLGYTTVHRRLNKPLSSSQ